MGRAGFVRCGPIARVLGRVIRLGVGARGGLAFARRAYDRLG